MNAFDRGLGDKRDGTCGLEAECELEDPVQDSTQVSGLNTRMDSTQKHRVGVFERRSFWNGEFSLHHVVEMPMGIQGMTSRGS